MKRKKRTKPTKTKEEQAAEEGWIYVYAPKSIRCRNSIWVEEAQGNLGVDEEKAPRP